MVFTWIVCESREKRDEVNAKVMADPRLKIYMDAMPFDGKRLIFGGFQPFLGLRRLKKHQWRRKRRLVAAPPILFYPPELASNDH